MFSTVLVSVLFSVVIAAEELLYVLAVRWLICNAWKEFRNQFRGISKIMYKTIQFTFVIGSNLNSMMENVY